MKTKRFILIGMIATMTMTTANAQPKLRADNIDEVIKVMDKIDPDEETKKKRAEPGIDPDQV